MSMNAAELAALIAAVFWALLVCVGVFVLIRMGRLMSESSKLVADVRERGDVLLTRAQAAVDGAQQAVDRAGRQLDQAESVTASMDELGAGMSELAGQVIDRLAARYQHHLVVDDTVRVEQARDVEGALLRARDLGVEHDQLGRARHQREQLDGLCHVVEQAQAQPGQLQREALADPVPDRLRLDQHAVEIEHDRRRFAHRATLAPRVPA